MDQNYFQSLLHQQIDSRYLQNIQMNFPPTTQNHISLCTNRNIQPPHQIIRPIPQQISSNCIEDKNYPQNRLKDKSYEQNQLRGKNFEQIRIRYKNFEQDLSRDKNYQQNSMRDEQNQLGDKNYEQNQLQGKNFEHIRIRDKNFEPNQSTDKNYQQNQLRDKQNQLRDKNYEQNQLQGKKIEQHEFRGKSYQQNHLDSKNCEQNHLQGKSYDQNQLRGKIYEQNHLEAKNFKQNQLQAKSYVQNSLEGKNTKHNELQCKGYELNKLQGKSYEQNHLEGKNYDLNRLQGASHVQNRLEVKQYDKNGLTDTIFEENELKDRENAVFRANQSLDSRENSVNLEHQLNEYQTLPQIAPNQVLQIPKQIEPITVLKEKQMNVKTKQIREAEVISYDEHLESIKNTPAYYLGLFLNMDVVGYLITEVNNHLRQSKSFSAVSEDEIRCFIAILYLSGYLQVPRRRMLWERSQDTQNALVSNAMQRDRFEAIFSALNAKESEIELNPLMERLNESFVKHCTPEEQHGIGELAFFKCKLEKVAKIWCACTKNGYCTFFKPVRLAQINLEHLTSAITMNYVQQISQTRRITHLFFEGNASDLSLLSTLSHFAAQPVCCTKDKTGVNPPLIGLDRLETNLGLYKISIGGKKIFSQLLTFSLDVAMQNAWILYKTNHPDKKVLDLLNFRRNIVVYYLQHYRKPILAHKGGRPLTRGRARAKISPSDARFDGVRHYVIPQQKQTRCAKCTAKTTTRCQKCDVGVHVKCFVDFHLRPKE